MMLIEGSDTDYITEGGNIYKNYGDDLYIKKKCRINEYNGYVYCGITMKDGKNVGHRVHRLVAKAFLPNPNNYAIVGHKNNIKHDNQLSNLYWTTISENTKKAFDDGLARNAKGIEDSQSIPIKVYINNEFYREYGSIKECNRELNIPISTICRRLKGEVKTNCRKYKSYDFKYS